MTNYMKTVADAWAVVARAEAEDALCMETWFAKLKERWAGFAKLRGLTSEQQEEVMTMWCQNTFVGQQDGELGRYVLARYILGYAGQLQAGVMRASEDKAG